LLADRAKLEKLTDRSANYTAYLPWIFRSGSSNPLVVSKCKSEFGFLYTKLTGLTYLAATKGEFNRIICFNIKTNFSSAVKLILFATGIK
jgi:hypothetical protein